MNDFLKLVLVCYLLFITVVFIIILLIINTFQNNYFYFYYNIHPFFSLIYFCLFPCFKFTKSVMNRKKMAL